MGVVSKKVSNAISSSSSDNSNNKNGTISHQLASIQHLNYLREMRSILPTIVLPEDRSSFRFEDRQQQQQQQQGQNSYPDCVFIEDCTVAVGRTAVINRMAAPTRRGEVDVVKETLLSLGIEVFDMRNDGDYDNDQAICDGGDVLNPVSHNNIFPGDDSGGSDGNPSHQMIINSSNHLFVGLSQRTNRKGCDFLKQSFPDLTVIPVPVPSSVLHLKSIVSHINHDTLLLPTGSIGDELLANMNLSSHGIHDSYYNIIRLPDIKACNVVSVNGTILAPPTKCNVTRHILEQACLERNLQILYVDSSELGKCDGALSCKSVQLNV